MMSGFDNTDKPLQIQPSTTEHEIRTTGSLMCQKCSKFWNIIKVQWTFEQYVLAYCCEDDEILYQSWSLL